MSAGEMLVGPQQVLFMDEISTGELSMLPACACALGLCKYQVPAQPWNRVVLPHIG